MTYIVLDNQKALKNTFQATTFMLKKIQALFKDLHRNLRTFQGKMEFKDFSRTSLKFKDFSKLCEPWVPYFLQEKIFLGILFLPVEAF